MFPWEREREDARDPNNEIKFRPNEITPNSLKHYPFLRFFNPTQGHLYTLKHEEEEEYSHRGHHARE